MTESPPETQLEPIKESGKTARLLYVGLTLDGQCWVDVTNIDNNGEPLPDGIKPEFYDEKRKKGRGNNIAPAAPGAIYEFVRTEKGVKLGAKYIGRWLNSGEVIKWQALHEAEGKSRALKSKENNDNKRRYDLEVLEPLRLAYRNATNLHRGLILAEIVKYVTSYVRPSKKE